MKTAKYTPFGHKRGQDILKELRTVLVQLNKYNNQLIQHVNNSMDRSRLPQAVMKLSTGRQNECRTLLNGLPYCDGETGTGRQTSSS
jgi:hypothetical protein